MMDGSLKFNFFLAVIIGITSLCTAKTINYVPMFDFDFNLLQTDARLMAMHYENGQWVPINVTDQEWAKMKDDPNYKKNPNMDFYRQYSDEEGYDTFKYQILRAINDPNNFGSAFPLWKKHVVNGVPFFIITARSHFPASIRSAMDTMIRRVLSTNELSDLERNFVKNGATYGLLADDGWWGEAYRNSDNILTNYLYGCDFFPVSQPFWAFRHNCSTTALCKAYVVRQLLPYALAFETNAKNRNEEQISVMSFFDDDKDNVNAVMDEMKLLAVERPEICFRVFDTHDRSQFAQYDINEACQGIEPGKDWQASYFHSLYKQAIHAKLY